MAERFEIAPGYEWLSRLHGLADVGAFFAIKDGERLDKAGLEGWRQRWRVRWRDPAGEVRTFYLKRFDKPPAARQFERWRLTSWRRSTAGVEWSNARRLAVAGVSAVEAAAFGEEMVGAWERRSFVLLAEAAGESLERWVPKQPGVSVMAADARLRRERIESLARFIGRFHQAGFIHRDLYLCHVFMEEEAPVDRAYRLIDLQRVFRPRYRRRRWMVKDLAALNFSAPAAQVSGWDRLRFLCHYVGACPAAGEARSLLKRINVKTRWMQQRRDRKAASRS